MFNHLPIISWLRGMSFNFFLCFTLIRCACFNFFLCFVLARCACFNFFCVLCVLDVPVSTFFVCFILTRCASCNFFNRLVAYVIQYSKRRCLNFIRYRYLFWSRRGFYHKSSCWSFCSYGIRHGFVLLLVGVMCLFLALTRQMQLAHHALVAAN